MRERIEDLGRISVLIDKLLDHELFNLIVCRDKDFIDSFEALEEDKRDDLLHNLAYGISSVRDELYEILCIAKGTDPLNEDW